MVDAFDAIEAKIDRAGEHLDALIDDLRDWAESHPYRFVAEPGTHVDGAEVMTFTSEHETQVEVAPALEIAVTVNLDHRRYELTALAHLLFDGTVDVIKPFQPLIQGQPPYAETASLPLGGRTSVRYSASVTLHQRTLFGGGDPAVVRSATFERVHLDDESWVDIARNWLDGSDSLFDVLVATVEWQQGRRWMFERMVDDPRLSRWLPAGEPLPHPAFDEAKRALEKRYRVRFGSVGLNYYRDGNDSVAWHRDRELRVLDDTRIAILTLGARRPFLIRPKGRGKSRDFAPAGGDMLVMGGRCQMDWEHNVPKVRHAGPRISCTWRWKRRATPEEETAAAS